MTGEAYYCGAERAAAADLARALRHASAAMLAAADGLDDSERVSINSIQSEVNEVGQTLRSYELAVAALRAVRVVLS